MTRALLGLFLITLAAQTAASRAAWAEVVFSEPGEFKSQTVVEIDKSPDEVYAALAHNIASWWNPAHSWSGDAKNFSLDAKAGGCFCEALPDGDGGGGSVLHLTVVLANPGKLLRLHGGLGPLQGVPVRGVMTWSLKDLGPGKTQLTQSYHVSGKIKGGLTDWAAPVDGVQVEQVMRLKSFIETGNPAP